MVEEGASEMFDEISIKKRDSMSQKKLLKYIRSISEFEKHRITPRLMQEEMSEKVKAKIIYSK